MNITERSAVTTWEGSLAGGSGSISTDSHTLRWLPVSWAGRTGKPGSQTSPEELLAAAHSSCFSMALALRLGEAHAAPQRLRVAAVVALDEVDGVPTVVSSNLIVRARVDGLDDEKFQKVVEEAAALCPVSRLFTGARISVEAQLEEN